MLNGVLRKTLEVHCAGCEEAMLGLPGRVAAAAAELRQQYGWAIRRGYWHCQVCKDDPTMLCARVGL